MSELRDLARFVANLRLSDVPQKVQETAKLCILDSVGAAIGAIGNAQVQNITALYEELAGKGEVATAWGQNKKFPAATAAFLNGLAGHTLELDDVHTNSKTHIGTVVVPAAWAAAEEQGKGGSDLLLAVICGYEVMARIGMGFGVSSHRNRGWHATSTAGTFGAAAACAKLLSLDEEKTLSALGMAGTQSFGMWAFLGDGASNKTLHPARAAASGLEAAYLARAGMTGPEHILDAKDGGLFAAMSDESDLSFVNRGLGTRYELLEMDNKPYPCCRSTHCAIDSALALRTRYAIDPGAVEAVTVETYLVGYKQCGASEGSIRPVKPIDAKFSTPYTVACALLKGEVTLRQFRPEVIADGDVQELLSKVKVIPNDRFTQVYPAHWGCHLTIACKDGSTYEQEMTDASGSVVNPLTAEQVRSKAMSLIRETRPEQAQRIADQLLTLDTADCLPDLL